MPFDFSTFEKDGENESLFNAVGFITIQWGHCEQSLEILVNSLFLQYGGNQLPKRKKMPRQLSDKIDFVKECVANIPSLHQFRTEIESLINNFESIKQTRHDLVHGALTDDPVIDGVFNFIRLETHPDIHEIKTFQFDLKEFPLLAKTLLNLGKDAPRIARLVFDAGKTIT